MNIPTTERNNEDREKVGETEYKIIIEKINLSVLDENLLYRSAEHIRGLADLGSRVHQVGMHLHKSMDD